MLTAGLDGVARGLDAGDPNPANLYKLSEAELAERRDRALPGNLLDATRELSAPRSA